MVEDCLSSLGLPEISSFLGLEAIAQAAAANSSIRSCLLDDRHRFSPGLVACRGSEFGEVWSKVDWTRSAAVIVTVASTADARGILQAGLEALPPRLFVEFEKLEPSASRDSRSRSRANSSNSSSSDPRTGTPNFQSSRPDVGGRVQTGVQTGAQVEQVGRTATPLGRAEEVPEGAGPLEEDGIGSDDDDDEGEGAGRCMPKLLKRLAEAGWGHLSLCRSTKFLRGGGPDPFSKLPARFAAGPVASDRWLHVQLPSCSLSRWPWTENLLEVSPMPGLKTLNLSLSIRDLCEVQDWQTFLPQGLEDLYLYFGTWLPVGMSVADGGLSELALPTSLRRLDVVFDWRDMRGVGAKALPRMVPSGLEHLRLEARSAWFQSGGLSTLACLPKRLLSLDLSLRCCCGVGYLVSSLISGMPEGLRTLELDVSYSDIQDRDVGRLATKLPSSLETLILDLSNCSAMPVAAPVLAYQLPKGLRVLQVSFAYTQVAKSALPIFLKSLPKSLESASFDLSGNYISGHRWPPHPSVKELTLRLNETVLDHSVLGLLSRLAAVSSDFQPSSGSIGGVTVSMVRCHLDEDIVHDDISLFATHLAHMRKECVPLFPVAEDEEEWTVEATTDPTTVLAHQPEEHRPPTRKSVAASANSSSESSSSSLGRPTAASPSNARHEGEGDEPLSSCSSCCSAYSSSSSVPPANTLVWDFAEGRVRARHALPPVSGAQRSTDLAAGADGAANARRSSGGASVSRASTASTLGHSQGEEVRRDEGSNCLVLPPLSRQFGQPLPMSGAMSGCLRFARV